MGGLPAVFSVGLFLAFMFSFLMLFRLILLTLWRRTHRPLGIRLGNRYGRRLVIVILDHVLHNQGNSAV